MKVLIVSGFLGAGKTTFIKELIRKTGTQPVILENEYGENDLDSRELSQDQDLKILEFMEGCVCCTMKGKFVNSILTISAGLDPEYLIIEPTGIGKLGNILASIRKISYEHIELLTPVVIVSPASVREYALKWGSVFRNQIENAGLVVFSKVENEDADIVAEAVGFIHEINPGVPVQSEHYSGKDEEWWKDLLQMKAEEMLPVTSCSQQTEFEQLTIRNVSLPGPGKLVALLEGILLGFYGGIVRAKGTVYTGAEVLRFDVADGMYAVKAEESSGVPSQCVFIGVDILTEKLLKHMCKTIDKDASVTRANAGYKSALPGRFVKSSRRSVATTWPSESSANQYSDVAP